MDPKWFPGLDRPAFNTGILLSAAFAAQASSQLLSSRLLRVAVGLPVFVLSAYQLRTHTGGSPPDDYLGAINLFWLVLRWIDLAVLRDPAKDLWQVNTLAGSDEKSLVEPQSLWVRIKRSLSLCASYRGIGWNWRVKNVDEVPIDISRSRFAIIQLLKFSRVYLISDFANFYLHKKVITNSHVPDLSTLPFTTQVLVGWASAIRGFCDISILYYLSAALAVLLHISEPQDWPPVFGSWRKMYTVRIAWGYCWHQFLRRPFEVYTDCAANILGIPKGTFVSRYFKLYGAFLLSAFIHHVGSLNLPWAPGVKYQVAFFMVQPFIISFEDLAVHIGKQFGLRHNGATQLLGYLWTSFAFSFTLPLMAKAMFDWYTLGGVQKKHPILIWSIADRLLG